MALTVDCCGILFVILTTEDGGVVTGDGTVCLTSEHMVQVLAVPAALTFLLGFYYLGYIYWLVHQELMAWGWNGCFSCCRKDPCWTPRQPTEPQRAAFEFHGFRLLRMTAWLLVVALLAYALWYSVGQATGGGDGPVKPWECPELAPSGCDGDMPAAVALTADEIPAAGRSFKLALWHEGYPDLKYNGADQDLFKKYVGQMISFAKAWKFSRVYLQISPPTSNNGAPAAPVYEPASVAATFLDPIAAAGIEPAFLAYISKKDCPWDRNDPLSDVAAYIKQVEGNASVSGTTIKSLVFDKEDLHDMAATLSAKITTMKANGDMTNDLRVGYAGGWNLFGTAASDQPAVQELFPELYWYGELSPHFAAAGSYDCSKDCVDAMPCFSAPCVNSPYRTYVNQPTLMNEFINSVLSKDHITSFMQATSRATGADARVIWALLSFEHLSGCCPERYYGPKDQCGTFDGFALWTRKKFLDFLEEFAQKYGFTPETPMPIGMYEWQFVPPHWMDPALEADEAKVMIETVSGATPTKCARI